MHHAMVYLVSVSAVERTKQMRKIENDLLRPRAGGEGGLAMLFIWGSRNAEKNDGTKEIAISDSENTGKKVKQLHYMHRQAEVALKSVIEWTQTARAGSGKLHYVHT